ncbi:hypothetical protein L1987_62692 [Smallanthus sonchifolius]|uniref:Uncharacterized protein n=1 Tax=Smallanthus sonchifolius TaxID=185202 RepID=A0ACB9CB62_9ASTR|nr:hypothetical protein L1987_62692 [Smallanthus sonchifolius]
MSLLCFACSPPLSTFSVHSDRPPAAFFPGLSSPVFSSLLYLKASRLLIFESIKEFESEANWRHGVLLYGCVYVCGVLFELNSGV